MGRTKGSLNKPRLLKSVVLSEDDKLLLIADLLLELVIDELAEQERGAPCKAV